MTCTFRVSALLAAASVMTIGASAAAQNISIDFEAGVSTGPATFFTSDDSGFAQGAANLDADGITPVVSTFAGSGGVQVGEFTATLELQAGSGVGGSQGAVVSLTNDSTAGFTFSGIQTEIGVLEAPAEDFFAFVDVLAPVGVAYQLRLESPFTASNNGFALDFVGTGQFETIGGNIGLDFAAIAGGTFDATAIVQLAIASPIGGGDPAGVSSIVIDNVSFSQVPEPASLALLGLGGIALIGRRRRSA